MNFSLLLAAFVASSNGNLAPPSSQATLPNGDDFHSPPLASLQWYQHQLQTMNALFHAVSAGASEGAPSLPGGSSTGTNLGGGRGGGAPGGGGGSPNNALFQMLETMQAGMTTAANGNPSSMSHTAIAAAGTADPQGTNTAALAPVVSGTNQTANVLVAPLGPPAGTEAVDDTLAANRYIARSSLSTTAPSTFNVSADAGVLTNDAPGVGGDRLIAGPVGGPVPALGSSSVIATTLGGVVDLGADGSFKYTPPVGVSGVTETFMYVDTEITSTGAVIGTSSPATVDIGIEAQAPTPFLAGLPAGTPAALDFGTDTWPKYHATTGNAGIAGAPGRTSAAAVAWTTPPIATGVEGSPILGAGPGGAPTVFIGTESSLTALSEATGMPVWTSAPPTGAVEYAPAAVAGAPGGVDFVVAGQQTCYNLFALDGFTGATLGSFLAQESYGGESNDTGPLNSSPTVLGDPTLNPGIPNGILFGEDGTQGAGFSGGRLYAVRSDGSVIWETLLAGTIDSSPVVASPSTMFPSGLVFVTTGDNAWGGRPDAPGQGQGRVYELDGATGKVLAENFVSGATVNSPVFQPGPATPGNPNGTDNGSLFVTAGSPGVQSTVAAFNPVIAAPPGLMESPVMTTLWTATPGLQPTGPALSTGGTAIYFADQGGLEAYSTTTGANLWTVAQDAAGNPFTGGINAAPAVAPLAGGAAGSSVILFGTDTATPAFYAFVDTGAGAPAEAWFLAGPANSPWHFDKSSPALSTAVLGPNGDRIFVGSSDGIVFGIA